ncbi:DUF488 domain-containing protein [Desemzia sp. FAM 23991]|uniref:DUF488 domain-containing protein n=1 Tax=unclassified Desemzia TaxID=2685243 RepID=UPI003885FA9F
MEELKMKRVYEKSAPDDGYRILVDRIWPRGVKKAYADIDEWCKEITPTTEARKAFGHDPDKFEPFKMRYLQELEENPQAPEFIQKVHDLLRHQPVTLVYAAKNETYNHVVILKEFIEKKG